MNKGVPAVLGLLLILALLAAAPVSAEGPDRVSTSTAAPPGEPAPPTAGPGLFVTTTDNEDNARTGNPDYDMGTDVWVSICNGNPIHPIEFNIENDVHPVAAALLSILAYDVDSDYTDYPELDGVYFEGHYLGDLSGADEEWSVDSFTIDPAWVRMGNNLVQIQIERNHPGNGYWCAYVRWGALEVEEAVEEPEFVPEPGTLALLGTGLASLSGYAALRWRSRRKE
jgi:hypothetical protein